MRIRSFAIIFTAPCEQFMAYQNIFHEHGRKAIAAKKTVIFSTCKAKYIIHVRIWTKGNCSQKDRAYHRSIGQKEHKKLDKLNQPAYPVRRYNQLHLHWTKQFEHDWIHGNNRVLRQITTETEHTDHQRQMQCHTPPITHTHTQIFPKLCQIKQWSRYTR